MRSLENRLRRLERPKRNARSPLILAPLPSDASEECVAGRAKMLADLDETETPYLVLTHDEWLL